MISYRRPTGLRPMAGVHALLIGISDYPYLADGIKADEGQDYDLGMQQLSSPALSAVQMARWLLRSDEQLTDKELTDEQLSKTQLPGSQVHGARLPGPLASFRLLIAPSQAEREQIARLEVTSAAEERLISDCAEASADDCTFDQVKAALHQWRSDCATNRENIAWFYFAGHGIQQLPDDPIMLLAGFNARDNPVLGEALRFEHVFRGMEVTLDFKKMARQQQYIVDACRSEYAALARLFDESPTKPWSYKKERIDQRSYGTIFGTTGGKPSYGSPEGTVLSQALLRALEGEAADAEQNDASKRIWNVKQYRLLEVLHDLVAQIAKRLGETQTTDQGPTNANVIWSKSCRTPILPVSIELNPSSAHPPESLCLQRADADQERMSVDLSQHPYATQLEAGHYSISVTFPAGHAYRSYQSQYLLYARPPWEVWPIPLARALP